MKDADPKEVHEMRQTLRMFKAAAKTVSVVQGKLRDSFSPPPADEECLMERLVVPPHKTA